MCVRFAVDTKLVKRTKEKIDERLEIFLEKREEKREEREEKREFYIGRDRIGRGRERTRRKDN